MRPCIRWLFLVIFTITIASLGWYSTFAQGKDSDPDDRQYFPETGHWITGDFYKTYHSIPNPIEIYGYPITEAYTEQTLGRIVQYFERARFEVGPDNPPGLRVKISPLGELLYKPGSVLPMPDNFPACKTYSETGYQVCFSFLDYYLDNGGAAQFGYPISGFELHDDRIVQYFQRTRFEWHPELPSGQKVVLTDVGRRYFHVIKENPIRLLPPEFPNNVSNVINPVLELQVRAFPKHAVLPASGSQTIYVIVQDQNLLPVSNAEVTLTLRLPSGQLEQIVVPGSTGKNGVIQHTFKFQDQPPGISDIVVRASYDLIEGRSITSFRIWW